MLEPAEDDGMVGDDQIASAADGLGHDVWAHVDAQQDTGAPDGRVTGLQAAVVIAFLERERGVGLDGVDDVTDERHYRSLFFGLDDGDAEFLELTVVDGRGSVDHHVASRVVLGEGDDVADGVEARED